MDHLGGPVAGGGVQNRDWWPNQLRVDLACHMLLTDPDIRVAEICYDVGFSNLSNFNRHFLKHKGMSPSQFRATFAAQKALVMAD